MRTAAWAIACVAAGSCVALGFYALFWTTLYRNLPHVDEMKAACHVDGAAVAAQAPAFATPAKCAAFFADMDLFQHSAVTQCLITALVAAFLFLVLRFRVRPPGRDADPGSGGRK